VFPARTNQQSITSWADNKMRLPADKADVNAATALADFPPESLEPHIPRLLEWLQDMNWPVARPVAAALSRCSVALVDPIRAVLLGNDDIWKAWVLHLLCEVQPVVRRALRTEVSRICEMPSALEIQEGACDAAHEVLSLLDAEAT
jgi:hypothetical protein